MTLDTSLIRGYENAVLTPNVNELRRLGKALEIPVEGLTPTMDPLRQEITEEIARRLDGPVVVSKGAFDVITNGKESVRCTEASTPRRCGGQGDILSGALAVFVSWSKFMTTKLRRTLDFAPLLAAAYGACFMTRRAARFAFQERRRSMLASDVILKLVDALESSFDS